MNIAGIDKFNCIDTSRAHLQWSPARVWLAAASAHESRHTHNKKAHVQIPGRQGRRSRVDLFREIVYSVVYSFFNTCQQQILFLLSVQGYLARGRYVVDAVGISVARAQLVYL